MKHACVQFSLVAAFLIVAASVAGPGAVSSENVGPALKVDAPRLVADSLPVPWPKRPGFARS